MTASASAHDPAPRHPAPRSAPRLTHVAFPTADLDRSVAFYERFAAMRCVKLRGAAGERVAWVAPAGADAPILVLVERPGTPPATDGPLRHLGFEFPDRAAVDAVHARLLAAGHDATPPVFEDAIVGYITMVRDPDGHMLEFNAGQDVSPAAWDAPSADD